jgi:hypothetical protein
VRRFLSALVLSLVCGLALTSCGGGGSSGPATLEVRNNTSTSIWYLYVSPSTDSTWGPDQLGANIIAPGGTFRLTGITCDRQYDLRVDSSSSQMAVRWNVYFGCGSTIQWTIY